MIIQLNNLTIHDTQPSLAVRPPKRPAQGCRPNLGVIIFAAIMTPVFICGATLLLYLVFPPPPLDVLVLGVDARPGEGYITRTDSIMLLGLKPSQLRASMLSIPRDLFINVPGYGSQRINTINVLGEQEAPGRGATLMSESITASFGITIERYARLNFQGFVALIDAVGGISIDVEKTIADDLYPTEDGGVISIRFDAGLQNMNGERALQYARTRHADDDYQRARRQQQVFSALLGKLANPVNWASAISVLNQYVDSNLTVLDMALYAPTILLNLGRFEQLVIDRDYIVGGGGGQAFPNYEALAPWLIERFD